MSTRTSSPASDRQIRGGRVVALGGGTGLSALLRGLKHRVDQEIGALTAVVTMSDDGGSSGRLRRELGALPPGDIRNCIAAVADDEALLARLFQYRFSSGEGLSGHSFGNLFLTALTEITGDFSQAVLTAESILSVRGRILPATLSDVRLSAVGVSGRSYQGESAIGCSAEPLVRLAIEPTDAPAFPAAVEAVQAADLIILGPGSLYTSILPNLLIGEIVDAVRRSSAPVVLLLNLMTQPGETDGMTGEDHLDAVERHAGPGLVDVVLFNVTPVPEDRLTAYHEEGASLVQVDGEALRARGVRVAGRELLAAGDLVRHEPARLAEAVVTLLDEAGRVAAVPLAGAGQGASGG